MGAHAPQTLCWYCKNACGGCSWSKSFKPVKGWTATYRPVNIFKRLADSYFVHECPEFEEGRRR